ncbi:MAG: precorrin-6A/cobalt-precorrin-6A reductase [Bermanella sp.]
MTLLLLGGTGEAKQLAMSLHGLGVRLIYSIAGLVRTPALDCEVVTGGFRQFGGLDVFIKAHNISAILDATHPYAHKMSQQATLSAKNMGIPCWRFNRAPWQPQADDNWHEYANWQALLSAIGAKKSVFLSAGQLPPAVCEGLSAYAKDGQRQLLRTALNPTTNLPKNMTWVKAIGPFSQQAETDLLRAHKIDCLVSKNSGGAATWQKILAARALGVPVYLLQRPLLAPATEEFNELKSCEDYVAHCFKKTNI